VSPHRPVRRDAVRILGVTGDGRVEFDAPLRHGDDPDLVAYDHGFIALRPLDARRDAESRLQLRLLVQPLAGEPRPRSRGRGRDPDLILTPGVEPEVRQRVAAYAVVLSDRGLLATEYSDRTAVSGRWGMPGGGLDDGEEPTDGVLREVYEETAQTVQVGELVRVQTSHWIGRSPHRMVQDFHAVRLIYRAQCPAPTDAEVLDEGGTTESARWVPVPEWDRLHWTANWQWILAELLATAQPDG
jgi:8-oxo-dGTP pyrophosphatase MutT (NUDIX family)